MSDIINTSFFQFNFVLQSVLNGAANGVLYSLLAMTVVLIYRTSTNLNFAQGEMAMLSGFLVWTLSAKLEWPIWIAIVIAMMISFVGASVLQKTLIRPVQRKEPVAAFIVCLGLLLIFNSLGAAVWGTTAHTPLRPLPTGRDAQFVLRQGSPTVFVNYASLGALAILAVIVAVVYFVLHHTRMGLSYRAVSSNPESSLLNGIATSRIVMFGWGGAAAIGCVAAVMVSQYTGTLDFNLMSGVLLYGFAAAVLGGLDSVAGAVAGGLLVGLSEAIIPNVFTFIGSDLSLATALFVIVGVLLVRPQGLFGTAKVVRV